MKKTLWIIAVASLFCILIAGKIFFFTGKEAGEHRAASGKKRNDGKSTVSILVVKPQSVQDKITTIGTIIADKSIELRSESAGRIVGIFFKEGSFVRKGSLLLKINDEELQAQLAKAEAALILSSDREKRQKDLLLKGAISREEYETSNRDLASSIADMNLIKAQINKSKIYAPFDGIIGLRAVDEGGYITTGTKIANLVSQKPVKIEFSISESFSGKVAIGDKLTFNVESSPVKYSANIIAIEPRIDLSTRTITIRGLCNNTDKYLVPGAFAKVEIILAENPNALLIPSEAIVSDVQGAKVYIVKNSIASSVHVITGIRTESNVEIIKGLNTGDSLIVSGLLSIRPGMTVNIRKLQ